MVHVKALHRIFSIHNEKITISCPLDYHFLMMTSPLILLFEVAISYARQSTLEEDSLWIDHNSLEI